MTNLEIIREACENNNYVALRGLAGPNTDKKYRKNQYLAKSLDLNNTGNDAVINNQTKKLQGTCGCMVTSDMTDKQLDVIIKNMLQYTDSNKVIVITGEGYTDGEDYDESILFNVVGFDYRGAKFVSYLGDI